MRTRPATRRLAVLATRYRAMFAYVGIIWAVAALVLASPLLVLPFYPDELRLWWTFALPAVLLGACGLAMRRLLDRNEPPLQVARAMTVVLAGWVGAIVVGAVPFVLALRLTPTQAMFESTSGWTTTGLSVVDVESAPHSLLFLRSALELAGGAGLAILMVAFMTRAAGPGLSTAEGRAEQLAPHVRASARLVISLYAIYAAFGTLALWAAGMGLFDAVNHAFAAVSTGGFSTRADSIGYWDSPAIEAVTIVLMLFGTTNFVVAHQLFRGRWRRWLESGETRLMAAVVLSAMLVLLFVVAPPLYGSADKMVRVAVFETFTALSTTGFSTVGYGDWSGAGWLVLIVLMLIGGGIGSTAGGIKQARFYMLARIVVWNVRASLRPRGAATRPSFRNEGRWLFFDDDGLIRTAGFVFLYLSAFVVGATVICAYGYSLQEALFEMASTLGTVGLSVGVTAADAPGGILWVQIVGMLLGRLEFLAVFIGLGRLFGDLRFLAQRRASLPRLS